MSVGDVWEKIESVKDYVKHKRQVVLAKRDIEFLLEYRDKMEAAKAELTLRTTEMDSIKKVLQTMVRDTIFSYLLLS